MGGAENLVTVMAPAQKNRGNIVSVLLLRYPSNETLLKRLKNDKIEVKIISNSRSVKNPLNIFSIMSYLKKCDIAHVHLFPANYWAALAKILSFSSTPIITTEHSTDNKRRRIFFFKYIENLIYSVYKEVIACSDKAKETFSHHYPNINCVSIPNGVNLDSYYNAKVYSKKQLIGVSEDTFVITMVSRFIPSKRQDTLVEAIAMLPQRYHAILVGGSFEDEGLIKIRKLVSKLNVSERVHFLYIRSDVPEILKSSDAILLSSEYEGLSLSSIEGMASGRPFIASDVNGLREVVQGAGILVKCADSKELADTILRLDKDRTFYENVVQTCVERSKQFDINNVVNQYQVEYNKYVKNVI